MTSLFPFLIFSLLHLAGETLKSLKIRYFTKPFLMPLLAFYYISVSSDPSLLLLAAMAGGWLGDIFLMIPDRDGRKTWFRPGLGAFLLGHLFYAGAFLSVSGGFPGGNVLFWIMASVFSLLGISVYVKLKPHMGKLAVPVTVYILVIAAMGISTALCLDSQPLRYVLTAATGALVFMGSDTINAWNRFATPVRGERIFTMSTYLAGQLLLVAGYLGFN